jgi:hypothetical protein
VSYRLLPAKPKRNSQDGDKNNDVLTATNDRTNEPTDRIAAKPPQEETATEMNLVIDHSWE